jgi:hypothetical protein
MMAELGCLALLVMFAFVGAVVFAAGYNSRR